MELGPVEQKIITQCLRERQPFPQRIQNAPEVPFGLELYFLAYQDLSTCRPGGMGLYPVPWMAVRHYAEWMGLDEEQEEELHFFVRQLDEAWIKYWEEKQAKPKHPPPMKRPVSRKR